jgi:hypothetical protein
LLRDSFRETLLFYKLNSLDFLGEGPFKRSEGSAAEGTYEGDLSEFVQLMLKLDPDSQFTLEQHTEDVQAASHTGTAKIEALENAAAAGSILNPLPDG